ncbi:hypothetical protein C9374_014009 [Naegleria lovaniensis]|uniref:UBX domain-containing protein n=1 Tax=Naegleria lovaniensis TaxID=51637 RepID=A0AA88H1D3_NAELO|nr:uncharacterized protein C9374_014009 [Naegleria lovaniensis]KAG2389449.1 hypothetical protein C9374_014009 [Naegleria lovaniensis]
MSSDPLADYRRLAAEKRSQWLSNLSSNQVNPTTVSNNNNNNTHSTTTMSSSHSDPTNTNTSSRSINNTPNKPKLKLVERSTQDIVKEREEELNRFSDILNPLTEKKKFIEKLKKEEEEALKKERQEKEKLLKAYRTDPHVGKKSTSIDYPNIDNRMALNSPTKPLESLETIFEAEESHDHLSEPCIIQIRFMDGSTTKAKFNSNDKLTQVCQYIFSSEKGKDYESIRIRIPSSRILSSNNSNNSNNNINNSNSNSNNNSNSNSNNNNNASTSSDSSTLKSMINDTKLPTYFNNTNMSLYTLEQLHLCPNGNIIIEKDVSENGFGEKCLKSDKTSKPMNYLPVEYILQHAGSSYRLKGDTWEEKQKFRERQRDKDVEQSRMEKMNKKKELEMVRKRLEEDKKERNEKKTKQNDSETEVNHTQSTHSMTNLHTDDDDSHDDLKKKKTSNGKSACSSSTLQSPCSIQVRLPNTGSTVKIDSLLGGNTLKDLLDAIIQNTNGVAVSVKDCVFIVQFPHAEYDSSVFKRTTLLEAKLVPRGSVVLESKLKKGVVARSSTPNTDSNVMEEDE